MDKKQAHEFLAQLLQDLSRELGPAVQLAVVNAANQALQALKPEQEDE